MTDPAFKHGEMRLDFVRQELIIAYDETVLLAYHRVNEIFNIEDYAKPNEKHKAVTYFIDGMGPLVMFSTKGLDACTIAHESYHVTCDCFLRMGIKYSQDSEEAFAYHTEMIQKKIIEYLLSLGLTISLLPI